MKRSRLNAYQALNDEPALYEEVFRCDYFEDEKVAEGAFVIAIMENNVSFVTKLGEYYFLDDANALEFFEIGQSEDITYLKPMKEASEELKNTLNRILKAALGEKRMMTSDNYAAKWIR